MGPTKQAVAVTVLCGDVTRRRHAFGTRIVRDDPTASRVYGRRWRPRRASSASSNSDIVPACHTHARDSRTTASDCLYSWLCNRCVESNRAEPCRARRTRMRNFLAPRLRADSSCSKAVQKHCVAWNYVQDIQINIL